MTIQVIVDEERGTVRSVYRDDIRKFLESLGGDIEVVRATNVEPERISGQLYWVARMPHRKGMIAVAEERADVIRAEVAHLNEIVLPSRAETDKVFDTAKEIQEGRKVG
jgi:hypothetical protein